jgi:hypothetical protein
MAKFGTHPCKELAISSLIHSLILKESHLNKPTFINLVWLVPKEQVTRWNEFNNACHAR